MDSSLRQIREDFDRIALVTEQYGGPDDTYHRYLISQLPLHCENVLEIGCGTGSFTRLIARRARNVLAVDLSPQMIRLARQQSTGYSNIEYIVSDVQRLALKPESFACIVSLATLHHLPMQPVLSQMLNALRPGGVLLIHDLLAADGVVDRLRSAVAYPAKAVKRLRQTGRLRAPRAVRLAWARHGDGEVYLTLDGVRRMCRHYLPGADIQRHLFWRYTVIWRKHAT